MNLVIDTNIFIAALIKNGLTRYFIVHSPFDLFIPEQEMIEIRKYAKLIMDKSKQTEENLTDLITDLLRYIRIIRNRDLLPFRERANRIIKKIDEKDVPFIAAALALDCGVWSDDKHFKKQESVKIFTTKEILRFYENDN